METNHPVEKIGESSMDKIISSIRNVRDRQIDELLKEPVLMDFLEHYYDTLVISNIKKQFLVKNLMELKNSPVDLSHYSSLITQLKESKTLTVGAGHKLFLNELKVVFQKYISKS